VTATGGAAPEDLEVRVREPAPSPLQRWSGLTREVGIVVAGILIAFSLDAWWDARRERLSQEAQLRALHEEFTANRERIDRAEERHRNIALRSRALLSALQLHPAGSEVQVADSLLGSVFEWRTQEWSMGSVEALIASGDLQRIADPELRRLLADWPASVEEMDEDQILGRDFVYAVAVSELARHADVAHLVDPAPKRSSGVTNIRVSTAAKAVVAARVALAELTAGSLRDFRAEVDAVLLQIQHRLVDRP
jgi:hypothetical protein